MFVKWNPDSPYYLVLVKIFTQHVNQIEHTGLNKVFFFHLRALLKDTDVLQNANNVVYKLAMNLKRDLKAFEILNNLT